MPAAGDAVLSYLQAFTRQAQDLTVAGLVFLVLTALFMMYTIDQAFDAIWKTHRRRNQITGFLAYWAVLTLGPLLIGLGLAVSSYLVSLPLLGNLTPSQAEKAWLIEAVPFTLIYAVMPRRTVPLRHALAGGLFAAVFFEAAPLNCRSPAVASS
ncbi:membrane protein [Sulfuricella sp. T08]|nr:membrane protein [Sulfuricella sp. T08]